MSRYDTKLWHISSPTLGCNLSWHKMCHEIMTQNSVATSVDTKCATKLWHISSPTLGCNLSWHKMCHEIMTQNYDTFLVRQSVATSVQYVGLGLYHGVLIYSRRQYPVQGGYNKKPIRNFSDLKNVTNAASQKTYPKFFGLEKCHECGITKNLSEFFRTWKMSRMSANLTQLVGLELCHGWVRLIFVPQKNLSID